MKNRYIGNFPPPYGGVTIKNQLLFEDISKQIKIYRLEQGRFCPQKVYQLLNCLISLLPNQTLIIGISGKGGKSLLQTKLLYCLNRNTMKRSIYFMMGGREAERIAKDLKQVQMYKNYKQIYVENQSMKNQLIKAGLNNVSVYPNCRRRPNKYFNGESNDSKDLRCTFFSIIQEKKDVDNILSVGSDYNSCVWVTHIRLKAVFFSRVTPDKGIDIILDVAKKLSNVEFHLYGEIDSTYSDILNNELSSLPNVTYHGVFKGRDTEVYDELARYDVMLLPTKWKHEGVPGVLVEAKIAGIPSIVSDICYNAEIVEDGVSGIVLKENTVENLAEAIERLDKNRAELYKLKAGAKKSAEMYYIENYIEDILKKMEE